MKRGVASDGKSTWYFDPAASGSGRGDEAQADMTPGIVDVQVHQDDGLPRPQGHPAPEHGQRHRRADEGGQDVVGPVTRRLRGRAGTGRRGARGAPSAASRSSSDPEPVSMRATPAVACGTKTLTSPSPMPGAEALELGREVDDALPRGIDIQLDRLHGAPILP